MNPAGWPRAVAQSIRGSFKIKLIVLLSCMVTIAFALAGWLVYKVNVELMEDEISKQFSIANEQALARLELTIQEVNRVSQSIILNPSIESFVRESVSFEDELFTQYKNRKYVEEQLTTLQVDAPSIRAVYLFNENEALAIVSRSGASETPDAAQLSKIMDRLHAHRGNLVWARASLPSTIDPGGRRTVLIAARRMLNDKLVPYGTMMMVLEESFVSKVLSDLKKNGKVLLLEPEGSLLYANTNPEETNQLMDLIGTADPQYASMEGITYLFVRHRLESAGFTLLGGVSLQEIQRKNKDIIQIFALAGIGIVVLSALLITISSRTLLSPLADLMQGLRRLRGGDFSARIHVRSGDELGYIGESFNQMAEQVGTLINRVYLAQISQRESELKAIQAQLNPHYLHNLFNELYWKLYSDDQLESAHLINAISEMLKYSLQPLQTDTTLGEELHQVRNYLTIQTELFTGEIETNIQVEESLLSLQMMRCLLLPVVENVFVHAFRDMESNRVLLIKAVLRDDLLLLEVTDNGSGIDASTRHALLNKEEQPDNSRTGIGMQSVLRRIELVYGAPYGVDIISTLGKGTTIRMMLPKKTTRSEDTGEEMG
ncbi:sensor histidine kinase [Paenibacillus daejeonensis]|uniref:sensor histidine kinase n=1 Tax=Paenibacillus daejeonensis TaxID=135193 RepID=UPI0003798913|nr:histidine kinase [Paenibacillus daejeonensis]